MAGILLKVLGVEHNLTIECDVGLWCHMYSKAQV